MKCCNQYDNDDKGNNHSIAWWVLSEFSVGIILICKTSNYVQNNDAYMAGSVRKQEIMSADEKCDPFVFESKETFYASHFLGQILVCAFAQFLVDYFS